MSLKIVGAGLGRTGTHSQKVALEMLLGAPCYHMVSVFEHPEDIPVWQNAAEDKPVDWNALMSGYAAAVDWPASSFWRELSEANPDAIILCSERDPESWWKSASATIFGGIDALKNDPERAEWYKMIQTLLTRRFTGDITNKDACIQAYLAHYADVKANAPKDRLLMYNVSEGWGPLCRALGIPEPSEPFPLTNTTEQFLARANS